MMGSTSIPAGQKCPSCGSAMRADLASCPSCGDAIPKYEEFTASLEDQGLSEFIQSVNQYLSETGAGSAESAFGLGCYIGFIPVALLVIILFLLGVRNWIVLALSGLVSVLATTGIATLLAQRGKATNIETTYHCVIEPQIESYLEKRSMTRDELDAVARQVLTIDAPLLEYTSSQRERGIELDKE